MSSKPMAIATEGLDAWRRGDFDALEGILDASVEWRWFEPGEWDCKGRDDVMRTLRERYSQGFAKGKLEFRDGGEDAVIVVSHPSELGGPDWPDETATNRGRGHGRCRRALTHRVSHVPPARRSS